MVFDAWMEANFEAKFKCFCLIFHNYGFVRLHMSHIHIKSQQKCLKAKIKVKNDTSIVVKTKQSANGIRNMHLFSVLNWDISFYTQFHKKRFLTSFSFFSLKVI